MGVLTVVIGRGCGRDMGGGAVVKPDTRMHSHIEKYLKHITHVLFLHPIPLLLLKLYLIVRLKVKFLTKTFKNNIFQLF